MNPPAVYVAPAPHVRLRGWKEIAARIEAVVRMYEGRGDVVIGVQPAERYSRLNVDPLPVRTYRGEAWLFARRLDEWVARRNGGRLPDGTRLPMVQGWVDICVQVGGVSTDTAQRWAHEESDPLPVLGLVPGGRVASAMAYVSAVRDWVDRHDMPIQADDARQPGIRKGGTWTPKGAIAVDLVEPVDAWAIVRP